MFRVHDYKTEITERHTKDYFYIIILSVIPRKEKIEKRRKEEKERGEELKIQHQPKQSMCQPARCQGKSF